ncbi:hypothetical protein MMC25_003898 [Agyrium rufum]|nr:hypothetical protein [Agyrium rufum]
MAEVQILSRVIDDIEMIGDGEEVVEVEEIEDGTGEEEVTSKPTRSAFMDYLRSPMIEIVVGQGETSTLLTAHEALLVRSPFFKSTVANFSEGATTKRIELVNEDIDAVGSFLEYLYTGEYFPRALGDSRDAALEVDPDASEDEGEQLLRHARVYTLADKLGVAELKALAHSKVHRVDSTAKGEIAYARYVYGNTPRADTTIRKPIASFWGMRAYVLRHDAEDDFKTLCLEYPEFAFDVLSFVLDTREKKGSERDRQDEPPRSSKKRKGNA